MKQGRLISKRTAFSKKLKDISPLTRALYLAAIPQRDDLGRTDGDPEVFKALVAPLWPETVGEMATAIESMAEVKLCKRYSANGQTVLQFTRDEDFSLWRKDLKRWAEYPNEKGEYEVLKWDASAEKWVRC